MPSRRRSISDTELDVLKALWAVGPAPVREVQEYLEKRGRSWAYNTVQTLLLRLVQKGYAQTSKGDRAHRFSAVVDRERLVGDQLRGIAEDVCDGSALPLIQGLVQRTHLSSGEIQELRTLLEDLEQPPSTRTGAKARGRRKKRG